MQIMSNKTLLGCALALAACSAEPQEGPSVEPTGAADVYRYVLGVDPATGAVKTGGAHRIHEFGSLGKADAIDYQNRGAKLHPELAEAKHMVYEPELVSGQTDWDVFPSQWWNQAGNGIARRWNGGSSDFNQHDDVDRLSPVEKYDLLFNPGQQQQVAEVEHWYIDELDEDEEDRGEKHSHPALTVVGPATAWELRNHGLYQGYAHPDNWWGHCNGWASYAIADPDGAPQRDIRVKVQNGTVTECQPDEQGCTLVYKGDIEAMMAELYFSDSATFAGRRCDTKPDKIERDEYGRPTDVACRDLNPGAFHASIVGLLGRGAKNLVTDEPNRRPSFVIDHNYDWEVWNFPLLKYELLDRQEVTAAEANQLVGAEDSGYQFNAQATRFVRIKLAYWMISDGVPFYQLHTPANQRSTAPHRTELNYVLELDDSGTILGGEWIEDPGTYWGENSKRLHPDFMWMAIDPTGWGEGSDDEGGGDDNPYMRYSHVRALLRCANDPTTCSGGNPPPPPPPALSCKDHCGSSSPVVSGDQRCYCDAACVGYGDCCGDYQQQCVEEPPPPPDPQVENTTTSCGQTISGTIALAAEASNVTSVVFLVDGTEVATDASAPYAGSWDSTTVADGQVQLTARGIGSGGAVVEDGCTITVKNESGGGDDLLFDDMESGVGGWNATGLWHHVQGSGCVSPAAASGSGAWYFGRDAQCNYDGGNQMQGTLTSPAIAGVSNSSVLSFAFYREVEKSTQTSYDFTRVEVAADGSSNWKTVWSRDSLTASQKQWASSGEIPLGEWAGQTVRVRFTFDSVDGWENSYVGWLIDDVRVTR